MTCPSWSNNQVFEFLDLYRREPILWDPKHTLRKDKIETMTAWKRIKSEMSIPCSIEDMKRKKDSLMAIYRSHKRKALQSAETTSWYAFPVMDDFLNERYGVLYASSSNLDSQYQEESQNDSSCLEPQDAIYHNTIPKTVKGKRRNTSHSYLKNKIYKSVVMKSSSNQSNVYKMEDSERLKNISVDDNEGDSSEPDEYDLYAKLLVTKLRKLDEHQRDIVMHEIDNIMFQVKINSHRTELRSNSPSMISKMSSPVFIMSEENASQYEDENITSVEQL